MADPMLGEVMIFAGNFNPSYWAFCQGQILQITQYSALYSLLSTFYGGDGRTTFGLPDLRDRAVVGYGNADPNTGRSARAVGQFGGAEQVTLSTTQMPSHNHTAVNTITGDITVTSQLKATTSSANSNSPNATLLATPAANTYASRATVNATLDANSISNTVTNNLQIGSVIGVSGSNLPHDNMQPWLCMCYVIALAGIYPTRD